MVDELQQSCNIQRKNKELELATDEESSNRTMLDGELEEGGRGGPQVTPMTADEII